MSGVLLYKLSGRPTGRLVARGLGVSFGTAFYFRKNRPIRIALRWGGAELPELDDERTLNKATAIARTGKLSTFRALRESGVPAPEFSTSASDAAEWGTPFFGRTTNERAGRGITSYESGQWPSQHPLYVQFIPDCREYRLHVVRGDVISLQRKYLERPELDRRAGAIKNHNNGYVFKTPERDLNASRKEAAIAAVDCLGLDFGAVDLIIDPEGNEYVLEVNSAPALSPMRVNQYVEALRRLL